MTQCERTVYSWAGLCMRSWSRGKAWVKHTWNSQSTFQQGAWPCAPGATSLRCVLLNTLSFILSSSYLILSVSSLGFFLFFLAEQIGLSHLCFLAPSFYVSAPLLISLSFNYPSGSRERSLHKAKAGTSLPVYIKNLSFRATGSAVREKHPE